MAGVGAMLAEHASGLSEAVNALVTDAMANDNRQKRMAFELRKEAMALPAFEFHQHIVYDERQEDGSTQKRVVRYDLLIPGTILWDGRSLEIQKYDIKSTFEAMMKKVTHVDSGTEVGVHGKPGFLGIPKVSFDITQKINVSHDSESEQHNTFDIDIHMAQSEAGFGYTELVKALMRSINTIIDDVLKKGMENPVPISDEEAAQLTEEKGDDEEAKPEPESGGE